MKDMIERYVYAVTRQLPESIQEEVKEELQANIHDMLPGNATPEDTESVLKTLGHPRDMAAKYQPEDRYLISPRYFADYLYTLKIVIIIFVLIKFAGGTIEAVIGHSSDHVFDLIGNVIGVIFDSIFDGLFTAFAVVTIIFFIIEYAQRGTQSEWNVKDLPELPKENTLDISRTATVFSIIFTVSFSLVFILILMDYHRLIGIYADGELIAPFFNPDAIDTYIPLFIGALIIALFSHVLRLIDGCWMMRTAITYTIHELIDLILLALFLSTSGLILPEFHVELAHIMDLTAEEVARGFEVGFNVLIAIVSIITIIDLSVLWYKIIRHDQKQKNRSNHMA